MWYLLGIWLSPRALRLVPLYTSVKYLNLAHKRYQVIRCYQINHIKGTFRLSFSMEAQGGQNWRKVMVMVQEAHGDPCICKL